MTEPKKRRPDFVSMACTTANVSFRELLTKDELVQALLSGKVPGNRRPHLRCLIDEAPETLVKGLIEQVTALAAPGDVENNLLKITEALGVPKGPR
jgi:hypothetical protein